MTTDNANSPATEATGPCCIGVLRAPDATIDPTLAEMEARIVRVEVERRLGSVTLDFRTEGTPTGPWQPRELASWPGSIDAMIDLGGLDEHAVDLTALFGRTVEPAAADVRSRMLHHLGVLPVEGALTGSLVDELLPPPARPTDLWLVARATSSSAISDPAFEALRADDGAATSAIDRWFDAVVESLPTEITGPAAVRLRAELDDVRARLAAAADELVRAEREALERIDDLTAERDSLRERLDRAQLDRTGATRSS